MNILIAVAIFLTGIAASFIGGVTSGGGGLIFLPVLIFLGLPPEVAVATNRFGSIGWVASTLYKFTKAKKVIYKNIIPLIVISVIGGAIGANVLINIDKALLAKIIGAIILILLPIILWKKNLGIKERESFSPKMLIVGFVIYFLFSIYDGFIGVAGGILVAYLFVFLFGMTYTQANATEKIPYSFNLIISVIIFASHNLINYYYGIIYLIGALIGGYLGAYAAIKKGDKWVRAVFIIVAIIFGIKLVFFG